MGRFTRTTLLTAGLSVALASSAVAQPPADERITLKFDTPMMVPGATLAPGTYLFTEAKTEDVMLIYNEDQTRLMATALTIPAEREEVSGETAVTIQRTAPGLAPVLAKVFYPGRKIGHELVYSQEQARVIADETRKIVLSHDAPEGSDMDALGRARLWRTGPGGQRTEYRAEQRTAEPGRSGTAQATRAAASGREGAEQHLAKIEELLDRMLQRRTEPVGTTGQTREGQILVDRAQLEQIKSHLNQLRQQLKQQNR